MTSASSTVAQQHAILDGMLAPSVFVKFMGEPSVELLCSPGLEGRIVR